MLSGVFLSEAVSLGQYRTRHQSVRTGGVLTRLHLLANSHLLGPALSGVCLGRTANHYRGPSRSGTRAQLAAKLGAGD